MSKRFGFRSCFQLYFNIKMAALKIRANTIVRKMQSTAYIAYTELFTTVTNEAVAAKSVVTVTDVTSIADEKEATFLIERYLPHCYEPVESGVIYTRAAPLHLTWLSMQRAMPSNSDVW